MLFGSSRLPAVCPLSVTNVLTYRRLEFPPLVSHLADCLTRRADNLHAVTVHRWQPSSTVPEYFGRNPTNTRNASESPPARPGRFSCGERFRRCRPRGYRAGRRSMCRPPRLTRRARIAERRVRTPDPAANCPSGRICPSCTNDRSPPRELLRRSDLLEPRSETVWWRGPRPP